MIESAVASASTSAPTAGHAQTVSIIVPTMNEAQNLERLISRIVASDIPFCEILFVDADSNDGTPEVIRALATTHPIRLIRQDAAQPGLAAAILSGAELAKGELLVVMDADLSHPPERISELLAPLLADTADIVLGSRYVRGGSAPDWPLWRRILSRAGAAMGYPLTGVHDSMSGFFAISRSRLMQTRQFAVGFKIAFEIIIRARPPLRVREIAIVFQDRIHGCSKMSFGIAVRFFVLWCRTVLRRLRPDARYPVGRSTRHAHD